MGGRRLRSTAVTPVALIADAIRDCSNRRAIVLDPFGGSGSTLIAAERTGRKARLIEIDARYADTIVRRWHGLTGGESVDPASGQTFGQREARNAKVASTEGSSNYFSGA